jgi:hypothetical protein
MVAGPDGDHGAHGMLIWILGLIAVVLWVTAYAWYFHRNLRQLWTRLWMRGK